MTLRIVLLLLFAIAGAAAQEPRQSGPIGYILPADVIASFEAADPKVRSGLCENPRISDAALATPPITAISGLNSRQDNVDHVPDARQLESFVESFGANSIKALASGDADAKTRLVRLLAAWANAGALLKSRSCVKSGSLLTTGKCSEWKDPEGRDLSGMKDATFTTFLGAALVRTYYVALADHDPAGLREEHLAIAAWIKRWSQRLKRPTEVYFGLNMGWYWPAIINDLANGNRKQALGRLKKLEAGLTKQINSDGSIVDRTTRGDRALWYHHTSIGEIVVSMELMRAAGMAPSELLEKKLHGAVDLFLRAVDNPDVLDEWARKRRNSRYAGKQEWNSNWPNANFAGTWFHVYPYRYPDTEAAQKLRRMVSSFARSAVSDIDLGLGLGCIYTSAATSR